MVFMSDDNHNVERLEHLAITNILKMFNMVIFNAKKKTMLFLLSWLEMMTIS